jgi:hypothetical protein
MSDAPGVPPLVDVYYATLRKAPAPITEAVTKIGGAPVFLEPASWPQCRACAQPMQFLAQFRLDDPLPLAQRYQMAYVFMCEGCDDSWDPASGVNAVLLQPPSAAHWPQIVPGAFPDYAVEWRQAQEPPVDRTDRAVDEDLREMVELCTKVGGAPGWIQYEDTPVCPQCGGAMHFIAELEGFGEWDGARARFVEQNFGDSGSSYIFLCAAECGPRGAALTWQCM